MSSTSLHLWVLVESNNLSSTSAHLITTFFVEQILQSFHGLHQYAKPHYFRPRRSMGEGCDSHRLFRWIRRIINLLRSPRSPILTTGFRRMLRAERPSFDGCLFTKRAPGKIHPFEQIRHCDGSFINRDREWQISSK